MRLNSLNQLMRDGTVIDGSWFLTKHHFLQYRRRGREEEVILEASPVEAKSTGFAFQILDRFLDGDRADRRLTLRGRWQADPKNRLNFLVERQGGRYDWLTLQGAWEIGKQQEIIYRFHREKLKTKSHASHLLRFQGYWDIGPDRRLTYVLDKYADSQFRFRGTFQTPSILSKKSALRYQLGLEINGRHQSESITLFGKWKLSRNLQLAFEVPYEDGSVRGIDLGAEFAFNKKGNVSAHIQTREGKPLGLEILLTRQFLQGEGEAFARLRKSLEETAVEAGVRFHW